MVLPEVRDSHLAGQMERERARERLKMGKSRKQRDSGVCRDVIDWGVWKLKGLERHG